MTSSATRHLEEPAAERGAARRWSLTFLALVAASMLAFLLAPWPMQEKTLAALHGLCAQRPSRSFWFGDLRLPFDARMTGIYGGFAVCQLYLLARGRLRVSGLPSLPLLGILSLFVVAMGIDGVNSTLGDIGLPTLYQPNNTLRFITGALMGTTLGVFLWLLAANLLWRRSVRDRRPLVQGTDLVAILTLAGAFGLLAASGWPPLYRWIALTLTLAAVAVLFTLALAAVQIARRRENTARQLDDLSGAAIVALVLAVGFMVSLAAGRFMLEAALNLQPLP